MEKTTLLVMAAGIGARYGAGIKQLATVDEQDHIIIDYSIHDAIAAGFDRIVFIIRHDIEQEFREIIGDRIEAVCKEHGVEVAYAFQNREDIPAGFAVPAERTKPWGTGQAVLAARDQVDGPFAVINADDYYGKGAFALLHDFLIGHKADGDYCMAGFVLKNTLSDNGAVTRGVCRVDERDFLSGITETHNIVKVPGGAEAEGRALDLESTVSMNMWGLQPEFLDRLEQGFAAFFRDEVPADPLKKEFLIPSFIGDLLEKKEISVQVLRTEDMWFGVTYQEDRAAVMESFRQLLAAGVYRADLYSDL